MRIIDWQIPAFAGMTLLQSIYISEMLVNFSKKSKKKALISFLPIHLMPILSSIVKAR
jgi:hypothetical protein